MPRPWYDKYGWYIARIVNRLTLPCEAFYSSNLDDLDDYSIILSSKQANATI